MADNTATHIEREQGSPWRVLAVVLLASLAGGAILAGFLLIPKLFGKQEEISDRDRELLIVVGQFEPWTKGLVVRNDLEQLSKTRYDDGTVDLLYVYDRPRAEPPVYLRCEVIVAKESGEAAAAYRRRAAALLPLDRVERTPHNEQFAWGNESQFGDLTRDGHAVGRYFDCRKGNRVYSLIVYGVNTDLADEMTAMLEPVLRDLEDYSP